MSKFISEKMVYKVSFIMAWAFVVIIVGFVAAQSYIRWTINQNFTFIGGFGLEALILATFALIIALLFAKNRD